MNDHCSTIGAIPAPLLTEEIEKYGFTSIQQHMRSRLTSLCSVTSSDPHYITHCFDMLSNLSACHNDMWLVC